MTKSQPPPRPKCECPPILTDSIHGTCDEGNWWHQEPCPLVYWLRKYRDA